MTVTATATPDPMNCRQCGEPHVQPKNGQASCIAHRKSDGKPCTNPKMRGQAVCRKHGGAAGQNRRAAARRLAEAEVAESIKDVVVDPIANPLDALAELAADAVAWKQHLANIVGDLKAAYRFTDDKGAEHLDARVALFERAMDRCQKYLTDWVRLGFEERKAQLDDARAALVRVAVLGILASLGHDPSEPAVEALLRAWLPVLDGAPAPMIETTATEETDG